MATYYRARLTGVGQALQALQALKRTLRNKILRNAVREGAGFLRDAVRPDVPVETGLLKRAMGVKVKTYRSGDVSVGLAGRRTEVKQWVRLPADRIFRQIGGKMGRTIRIRKPRPDQLAMFRDPRRYAHLQERGNYKKPGGLYFMRRAFERHKGTAQLLVASRLRAELLKLRYAGGR